MRRTYTQLPKPIDIDGRGGGGAGAAYLARDVNGLWMEFGEAIDEEE